MVYPRAIQVARSLKEMARRGWSIDVVALDANSDEVVRDGAFAALYSDHYRLHTIDVRDILESGRRKWPFNYRFKILEFLYPRVPPSMTMWMRRARAHALRLIRTQEPRVLITFAQPWADHLIGLSLKKRHPALPWIAHFSDPWVDSPYLADTNPDVRRIWQEQERAVIEHADAVIFVNAPTADLVMKKYPREWRRKIHVVPHGYDPDLRDAVVEPSQDAGRMRLVYTGSMFPGLRDPLKILEALVCLKRMLPPERMPITEFVGMGVTSYRKKAEDLGLDELTRFDERVGYLEALRLAARADVLLMIDTNTEHSVFLPSKISDYLMFGKPIFALTPRDAASVDALRPLGHMCVNSNDPEVIAGHLADLLKQAGSHGQEEWLSANRVFDIARTTDALEQAIDMATKREAVG